MDTQREPLSPSVLHDGCPADIHRLFDDIQLAEHGKLGFAIRGRVHRRLVLLVYVLNVAQPVVRQPAVASLKRALHTAAAVVTDNDDVLHLQQVDCELR